MVIETPESKKDTQGSKDALWYCCPECGQKIFKIFPGGKISNVQVKCKKCRKIIMVSLSVNGANFLGGYRDGVKRTAKPE